MSLAACVLVALSGCDRESPSDPTEADTGSTGAPQGSEATATTAAPTDACPAEGSCLHYEGTMDGTDFAITCLPGAGLTGPSHVAGVFNSGCGMGAGAQPLDAGAFQIGDTATVGSFTYTPADNPGTADPSVNLQFSGMLGFAGTDSATLDSVTITIQAAEPTTLLAGTFDATWTTPAANITGTFRFEVE